MLNLQLANKYSRAIFLLAQEEGKLTEYGDELKALSADMEGSKELTAYFSSPLIPTAPKKELAGKVFGDELSPMVMNFLQLLLDKQRVLLLPEIAKEYEDYANEAQGILVADVTTARELGAPQGEVLAKKLSDLTGKTVKLRRHLDPKLIGGAVVRIGDRLIDGSMRSRIKALETKLMAK